MSRFFVEQTQIKEDHIEITDREDIRHIARVLRMGQGSPLEISDSSEFLYQTEILSLDQNRIVARILDKQRFTGEPLLKVSLFQGIPKQGKLETIIQKSVELGVFEIVPVFTCRSVVAEKEGQGRKTERYQKIAAEAVKQCRRGMIPKVRPPLGFQEMLEGLPAFQLVLFPYEEEGSVTIKDALRGLTAKPENLALIIGPEGGFSREEAEAIVKNGGISVSLGKTILRTETAGPAAMAMAMYELEL